MAIFREPDGRSSVVPLSTGISQVFCHPLVYIEVTEEGLISLLSPRYVLLYIFQSYLPFSPDL